MLSLASYPENGLSVLVSDAPVILRGRQFTPKEVSRLTNLQRATTIDRIAKSWWPWGGGLKSLARA
jgi:hypothetical protein